MIDNYQLIWHDRLLVGHGDLDAQHQRLFTLGNKICSIDEADANEWAICEAICLFGQHVKSNFLFEERLMASARFPMASHHIADHQYFLHNLKMLSEYFECGKPFVLPKIKMLLSGWLPAHVFVWDKELGNCIRGD